MESLAGCHLKEKGIATTINRPERNTGATGYLRASLEIPAWRAYEDVSAKDWKSLADYYYCPWRHYPGYHRLSSNCLLYGVRVLYLAILPLDGRVLGYESATHVQCALLCLQKRFYLCQGETIPGGSLGPDHSCLSKTRSWQV